MNNEKLREQLQRAINGDPNGGYAELLNRCYVALGESLTEWLVADHKRLVALSEQASVPTTATPAMIEAGCAALVGSVGGYEAGLVERCYAAMLAAAPQPVAQAEVSAAARDVLAERQRQITAEGWTPEHDDAHRPGQIACAGGLYAQHAFAPLELMKLVPPPLAWPWHPSWWKPSEPRRMLVKAGALILAEIERLDRAAQAAPTPCCIGAACTGVCGAVPAPTISLEANKP